MRKPLTLTVDAWGNVIVARALGNHGTFIAKLDKEGNVLWEQILGEGASHQPHVPAPALSALVQPEEIVTSDDRDSVEPLMIDPELEELERDLSGPSRVFRGLGIAAMLAALFAFGIAGGAALRHASAASEIRPAAASSGIRGVLMSQADRAVASADPVITVDDTVGSAAETAVDEPLVTEHPPEPVASEEPAVSEPAQEHVVAAPVAKAPATPVAKTAPAKESEPKPEPQTAEPTTPATLRKDALAKLNAGKSNEAATAALQLVAAAPSDAFSYLVLGAAHQAAGRIAEAATAYRTCLAYAKHGDVEECRALAR